MSQLQVPLSYYFSPNVELAIPFVFIPSLIGTKVGIVDTDNQYYIYEITYGNYNHYNLLDTIKNDKDNWVLSNQSDVIRFCEHTYRLID